MVVTLLEALTRRATPFNAEAAIQGTNTVTRTDIEIGNWTDWTDFTYECITNIYRSELATEYHGQMEPRPLKPDLAIHKEVSVEDGLRRFRIPIVNYALERMPGSPHYARGDRCGTSGFEPDWSCVSDKALVYEGQTYRNLVPGDTKISSKWCPEMRQSHDQWDEWYKVICQIVTYVAEHRVRYGFIVTDDVLVVLRISRQYTEPGLASTRPPRLAAHYRQPLSEISMGMSDPANPSSSISEPSTASYEDNDPLSWDYHVENKVIPWAAHGHRLTPNLALWALAMMSLGGDSYISYQYPGLNTWRVASPEGGGVKHNATGATSSRQRSGYIIEEPALEVDFLLTETTGMGELGEGEVGEAYKEGEEEDSIGDYDEGERAEAEDLPQFSGEGSDFGDGDLPALLPAESSRAPKAPKEKETITVSLRKYMGKYRYKDYKGGMRYSTREEWKKVDGGYLLSGKSHNYFTKKLP